VNDSLSFGDIEILNASEQFECRGTVQAGFCGVDLFGGLDACIGKKLLRFST